MSSMKQQRSSEKLSRKSKQTTDFSKVGGLANHIKILRDTIIVPLLHNNVYSHFNIKTPRGILFYGPPGTGKTLVAGALATELNKEGFGKVSFYQRKGADVLDKWVGESEKKLRTLFENASKNRPSIIFFDELDGLAPIRSVKNDHVHCSIVTTLLALMDGLDSVPGVIVIGATNRIESVDPALRRPGRFDRELYFPLPSTEARKEILQVHMQTWRHRPSNQFISELAEMTTGFCGSDLQALCAEALLCAMKRQHPNIQKCLLGARVKIEAGEIRIDDSDFINARKNLIPSSHKMGIRMRKLSPVITPLLQKQLDMILSRVNMLWPHFSMQFYKYLIGSERYVGRVVLVGSNLQGLNAHLVPAILQNYEHLPATFLDAATLQHRSLVANFCKNLPSILVIPRVDDLWSFLDANEQTYIASLLEEVHAGLPILIIATYEEELPLMLQNFFYNNTTVVINIENPSDHEVEEFFIPLFFGDSPHSLSTILSGCKQSCKRKSNETLETLNKGKGPRYVTSSKVYKLKPSGKITKSRSNIALKKTLRLSPDKDLIRCPSKHFDELRAVNTESLCTLCGTTEKKKRLSLILTDLLQRSIRYFSRRRSPHEHTSSHRSISLLQNYGDSSDIDKQKIYSLWRRTVMKTAKDMPLAHLEVLYDTISACISIHKDDFQNLVKVQFFQN
ncbi:ATPase family AAA domain-containing protein 2 [Tribolium castaneum]|uniref:ATPase family AAA domain-containing protein 2B-like Protein n=1 Tax=Tribolium castaneum TaxID=7070 RepID=A0A139WHQ9_TRICA|nr:ATPase family AAA domain-containing protein 2B-like Protein [Tribolium castaneum]